MGFQIFGTSHLGCATMVTEGQTPSGPAGHLAPSLNGAPAGPHHMEASPEPPKYNERWLRKWLTGEPHITLGGSDPYLKRWYVLPRNQRFNIYLHKFCRSDEDRALHDHPWDWWSFILKGQYLEHFEIDGVPQAEVRKRFSLVHRFAEHAHRVQLPSSTVPARLGSEKPTWTLFVTTAKRREWGFHCPKGWVHWEKFTAGPKGERSVGCGEFS